MLTAAGAIGCSDDPQPIADIDGPIRLIVDDADTFAVVTAEPQQLQVFDLEGDPLVVIPEPLDLWDVALSDGMLVWIRWAGFGSQFETCFYDLRLHDSSRLMPDETALRVFAAPELDFSFAIAPMDDGWVTLEGRPERDSSEPLGHARMSYRLVERERHGDERLVRVLENRDDTRGFPFRGFAALTPVPRVTNLELRAGHYAFGTLDAGEQSAAYVGRMTSPHGATRVLLDGAAHACGIESPEDGSWLDVRMVTLSSDAQWAAFGNLISCSGGEPAPSLVSEDDETPIMGPVNDATRVGDSLLLASPEGIQVLDLSSAPPGRHAGTWNTPRGVTRVSASAGGRLLWANASGEIYAEPLTALGDLIQPPE